VNQAELQQPPATARTMHPWVAKGLRDVRFGVSMFGRRDWSAFLAWVQRPRHWASTPSGRKITHHAIQTGAPRWPPWRLRLARFAWGRLSAASLTGIRSSWLRPRRILIVLAMAGSSSASASAMRRPSLINLGSRSRAYAIVKLHWPRSSRS
jgi:hypothetical protein